LAKGSFPAFDLSSLSVFLGQPIAGILGVPLLSKYVSIIDYQGGLLTWLKPTKFSYAGRGQMLPLQDSGGTGLLIIPGIITLSNCAEQTMKFSLDSGSNTAVTFNHRFSENHPGFGSEEVDPRGVAVGVGSMEGAWGNIHSVRLGDLPLTAPHVLALRKDATEMLDKVADASIGTPILIQFRVIVDRQHNRIILEPRTDRSPALATPCISANEGANHGQRVSSEPTPND